MLTYFKLKFCLNLGIRLFWYLIFHFLNMQHKRLKHLLDFCLDVPCMEPVMAGSALYWTDSSFLHHNQYVVSKTLGR